MADAHTANSNTSGKMTNGHWFRRLPAGTAPLALRFAISMHGPDSSDDSLVRIDLGNGDMVWVIARHYDKVGTSGTCFRITGDLVTATIDELGSRCTFSLLLDDRVHNGDISFES